MTAPLVEQGETPRIRARACEVPDWHRVTRCEVGGPDGETTFHYDDREPWVLPGLVEVQR